jgi:hypothetical protein
VCSEDCVLKRPEQWETIVTKGAENLGVVEAGSLKGIISTALQLGNLEDLVAVTVQGGRFLVRLGHSHKVPTSMSDRESRQEAGRNALNQLSGHE